MAPSKLLPTLAMLAAVFLWSSATPGSKFALTEIGVAEFVVKGEVGGNFGVQVLLDAPPHLPGIRFSRIAAGR